jgi:hypothetical protein
MAITNRQDLIKNMAKGKGIMLPTVSSGAGGTTAAIATSGHVQVEFTLGPGSSYPGTLVGIDLPGAAGTLPNELFMSFATTSMSISMGAWLVRYYLIGTLDLTGTGDKFTHDAATFPVLRTKYGEASKPVTLLPLIYTTTALTGTAAAFELKTNAGGAGYVDQDGNNVVGTKTFTFPSATTAVQSAFLALTNNDTFGVQDITQIKVGTAASAGAASIYGVELIAPLGTTVNRANPNDTIFSGIQMGDLQQATATSGTVTSYLGIMGTSGSGRLCYIVLNGTLNQ